MDISSFLLFLVVVIFLINIKTLYIILNNNDKKTINVVHWKSKNQKNTELRDKKWVMIGKPTKFKYYTCGIDFFREEFSYDEKIISTYKYSEIGFPTYYKKDKHGKIVALPVIRIILCFFNIIFGKARLKLDNNQ